MNSILKILLIISFILTSITTVSAETGIPEDKALKESRKIAESLMEEVGKAPQTFVSKEDYLKSMEGCSKVAPDIIEKYREKTGYYLKRTSIKRCNPDNSPDSYEMTVIKEFEGRKAQGKLTENYEISRITIEDDVKYFRYSKPILVKKSCLKCHGSKEEIPVDVKAFFLKNYPDNKAKNFKEGDLRGAISVRIPLKIEEEVIKRIKYE